jgi:hypothetical protein
MRRSNVALRLQPSLLEEARRVSLTALATPLAPAFPCWAETLGDIEVKKKDSNSRLISDYSGPWEG